MFFFDVTKCYDSISHDILLFKLKKYGIRGTEHCWFTSYLTGRKQASLCNNMLSSLCEVRSGVPQGSILGPVLFLLFMSDLPVGISEIFLYADDTMTNCQVDTVDDINFQLQSDIDKVSHWFKQNKLTLNISKSSVLYIGTRRKFMNNLTCNESLTVNNADLEINNNYSYLGLTIDNSLTWNNHVDMLCKKLSSRIGGLYRLSQLLSESCLIHLYYALIQSVIDYSLTIWGHTSSINIKKIPRFQNRATRICTQNFNYDIPSITLIHNLGWLNVIQRREYLTGLLMFKCRSCDAPNYLSDLFVETMFVHNRTTRTTNDHLLNIPFAHTNYYKSSLSVYGANLWNKIPLVIRQAQNVKLFKGLFKNWILSSS